MTEGLEAAMATAARAMDGATSSEEVLRVGVGWSTALVPGCEMAGVTARRRRGRVESMAPSGPDVAACDRLQEQLGEGPCLDAITDDPLILSADVRTDQRWPLWGERVAVDYGVAGMLSVRLVSSDRVHGALNLYSRERDAFDAYAIDVALLLATHVAVAVRSALAEEDMRVAVDSRHRIGLAQGILMQQHSMDEHEAFVVLSRLSQDRNIRLIDLADQVVATRKLPARRAVVRS